ncbi:type VII secretion-associated serine protease mycosin, partial [Streptomyces sp. SID5470]|nr:type VII secretion-associated serine protease mycosin [Streptomyces sp. SID5470]
KYFGPGPDTAKSEEHMASWVAPLAGGLGVALLIAAVFLWRGRRGPRRSYEGF